MTVYESITIALTSGLVLVNVLVLVVQIIKEITKK